MNIVVQRASDDPEAVKCPRCLRWHGVKHNARWPVESMEDGFAERHVICDRCSGVLLENYPGHPVSEVVRANRKWQLETKPWLDRGKTL